MSGVDDRKQLDYNALLDFVKACARGKPRRRVDQIEAYESGNFDDAWDDGYSAANWDIAEAAEELLIVIGEEK